MKKNLTLLEKLLAIPISETDLISKDKDHHSTKDFKGPSEYVLSNIFNYAKALSVVKLKHTGHYKIILN